MNIEDLNDDIDFDEIIMYSDYELSEIIISNEDVVDQLKILNVKKSICGNIFPVFLESNYHNLITGLCKLFS